MHFDVKGCKPKINRGIFEEPKNHRVFPDHKISKKMHFSESHLYMAMQGCILMLRVGAQKSIWAFLKSQKVAQYSQIVFFVQNVFSKFKDCFSVIGVVFSKMIFVYLKSPKIARNSGTVSF